MRQGFVKVAAATPKILVADCVENARLIVEKIREMEQGGAKSHGIAGVVSDWLHVQ